MIEQRHPAIGQLYAWLLQTGSGWPEGSPRDFYLGGASLM